MNYENPTPVVVALIRVASFGGQHGIRLLMIQRGIEPNIGGIAMPGGYVDKLESAEDAVVRETDEEVGLATYKEFWKPICTRVNANNRLLIFMLYEKIFFESDVLAAAKLRVPNEEIQAVTFADARDTSCFSFHTEIIQNSALWLPHPDAPLTYV